MIEILNKAVVKDIRVYEMSSITPFYDYSIIASVSTARQGNAAVNYTDRETPWTRIIEHKWFEFGKDEEGNDLPKTVISREYSSEWKLGDEPYYPVNDEKNGKLYEEYKKLAEKEENIIFGGRLGEYKYYDMDAVIAAALDMCEKEL